MPGLVMGRFLVTVSLLNSALLAQNSANKSLITGTWRGSSECIQVDSPCRNEVNVYRFSEIAGKPDTFTGTASKIVDEKEVVMGTLEWTYDPEHHALESTGARGTFRLIVSGNKMEGRLTLTDNTLYRRIHLERAAK